MLVEVPEAAALRLALAAHLTVPRLRLAAHGALVPAADEQEQEARQD